MYILVFLMDPRACLLSDTRLVMEVGLLEYCSCTQGVQGRPVLEAQIGYEYAQTLVIALTMDDARTSVNKLPRSCCR